MFKFLSLFRRNKDEQLNDNDYDFNEVPVPFDVQGKLEGQQPVLRENGIGAQPEHPTKPRPSIEIPSKKADHSAEINKIRAELSGLSADPQPPSGEIIDTDKTDSPFYKEGPITEDEKTEPVTAFGFRLEPPNPDLEAGNANFSSDNGTGVVTIDAHFPTDIRSGLSGLPSEQRELFDISDDGRTIAYPKKEQGHESPIAQDDQPANEGHKNPPMMDSLPPREFSEDERDAKTLTAEELAEMIRETPGDQLVMYTGAGISKGGGEPVWDMNELKNNVQVDKGSDAFLKALLDDPKALAETYKEFARQINTANPTDAHKAIKEIMDAKPGATLMTQNGDRNHEASGVRPIHMAALPEFYEFLKGRTDNASLIVTAGLHADELSFLKWAATKNPNVKIAASDLGKSVATYPSYLSKDDHILPGDAQQTLPEVAKVVKDKQDAVA